MVYGDLAPCHCVGIYTKQLSRLAQNLRLPSLLPIAKRNTGDELRQNFDTPLSLWMDDGMFSRWAMAEFPDIEQLLEIIEAQLPAGVFDLVLATVQLSGLAPFDSVEV